MSQRFDMKSWLRWFAVRNEAFMFSLAILYLVGVAILVVVWVDVPGLQERAQGLVSEDDLVEGTSLLATSSSVESFALTLILIVWVIVIIESIVHWLTRDWNRGMVRTHWFSLLFCICPALRMCARSPEMHGRIWLPGMGWRQSGRRLERQLERHFSVPMMIIALLIMPILVVEFFLKDQVAAYAWLRLLLHVGTGVIWFAFATEFILMVSIAEKKIDYCKTHWIDLAIILLPVVSFLRSLNIARTSRVAGLMRIQQLSNLARAYRLRGTAIKAFRVLILFDLTERILRISDESRLGKLERELGETEKHARFLRQKIAKLKRKETDGSGESQTDEEVSSSPKAQAHASVTPDSDSTAPLDSAGGLDSEEISLPDASSADDVLTPESPLGRT